MKKTSKIMIIVIIIIILLFIFIRVLSTNLMKDNESNKVKEEVINDDTHISSYYSRTNKNEGEISAVTDINDFFTVQNCVNKYIIYLLQKDTDSLFKLLDESYIKEFSITKENILEYVEDLSEDVIFNARKMYYKKTNNNVYTYYIIGELTEKSMEGEDNIKGEIRITVNMDIESMAFSIVPYGYGGTFDEEN